MPNRSSITSFLLILCSLSLTLALNPMLQASYFYMPWPNYVSYGMDQTRNGIIAFSIEAPDSSYSNDQTISQYTLIDVPNRDAKIILADLVSACEDIYVTPVFQSLHYHAPTDTLSYFCYANNSLLFIDQSSYTVKQAIPLGISGKWPVVKLATEGMGLAILLMGDLQVISPKASLLVKFDLQTKAVTAQINLDQGFAKGEAVVAYASNNKAAYIATNTVKGDKLTTTIYSIVTIGKKYQITSITSFSAKTMFSKVLTKLFCLGNYIAVNNGVDLYFLNQQGKISKQVKQLVYKNSNYKQTNFYDLVVTAQPGSTYLYLLSDNVEMYSVVADTIQSKTLGGFVDIKIAYGNSIGGDLMLTLNYDSTNFTIYDVKTMNKIYTAPAGFADQMLTDTTYVVRNLDTYIFDLKTNALIARPRAANSIYYTKEQHIISQWYLTNPYYCILQHIDLTTGKTWNTANISVPLGCSTLDRLRLTENGNPEYLMHYFIDEYAISSETYGGLNFKDERFQSINRFLNIDLDNMSFYKLDSNRTLKQTNISSYAFNTQTKKFEYRDSNLINNLVGQAFASVNTTQSVIVDDNTLVVVNGVGRNPEKYSFSQDWNSASTFKDNTGNNNVILTKWKLNSLIPGSVPGLFVNGKITNLPGTRKESARAEAAGVNSYWVADRLQASFVAVRFYKTDSAKRTAQKISL